MSIVIPAEIKLGDRAKDEVDEEDSFFDDSYRKPDDDARSVGSRSAASEASRRVSFVSGQRSRGRNSRRPGQPSTGKKKQSGGGANARTNDSRPKGRYGGSGNGRKVPREIILSGDELEDVTHSNVSNDTSYVKDKQIVDSIRPRSLGMLVLSESSPMYEGDWIYRNRLPQQWRWCFRQFEARWRLGPWTTHSIGGGFTEETPKNEF
mmetsp:Transcript_31134/g.74849  ORF Transcript_31134/g.74849 Transcript_31134/m.74849 type:complete len:207 (-) Transcript_31134:2958-3578(-)